MKYSLQKFPLNFDSLTSFLENAWNSGWLDEYSEDHFLIKAIYCDLSSFIGEEQFVNNNHNISGVLNANGNIDYNAFCSNFCINFSLKVGELAKIFGKKYIERYIKDKLSAGKKNYDENIFFEALSEFSILSFYALQEWSSAEYEPISLVGKHKKNPEAKFIGKRSFKFLDTNHDMSFEKFEINIEVKAACFPHTRSHDKPFLIPAILLSESGRKQIPEFCYKNEIDYINPRVLKLKDFLNSATEKFSNPGKNQFNILYINWSFSEFPLNGFLEAWGLLTNEKNGILRYPKIAQMLNISDAVFERITAVVVYTESLDGLLFNDFRFVWQRHGVGPQFRMWIIDENVRKLQDMDKNNILFYFTMMNPDPPQTEKFLLSDFPRPLSYEIRDMLLGLHENNYLIP